MEKRRFLVATSPKSDAHRPLVYVWARSKEAILEHIAGAEVWDPVPEWLTEEQLRRIGSVVEFDIDSPFDVTQLNEEPHLAFRDPDRRNRPTDA